MKKFNVKGDLLITVGLVALTVAQSVLSGKKQSNEMAKLEDKVTNNVMKNLAEKKD